MKDLDYDRHADRWLLNGHKLHCGEVFEVQVAGYWILVQVEYQDPAGWVLYADSVRILPSRSLPARRKEE